jgi:hypothetical protein
MKTLPTVATLFLILAASAPTIGADLFLVNRVTASASFRHVDGCINTAVFTDVSEQVSREPPLTTESDPFLTLVISTFDECSGAHLGTRVGSQFMSSFTFDVNATQDRARLIGSVTVFDTNRVSSIVTVDLVWTGEGELTHLTQRRHFRVPGSLFMSRITGQSRRASASGTVLDAGTNLVPLPSYHADMGRVTSGTVSTGKP